MVIFLITVIKYSYESILGSQVKIVILPSIPVLGEQRQVNLCEFKASLIYTMSSWPARAVELRPCPKTYTKPKALLQNTETVTTTEKQNEETKP